MPAKPTILPCCSAPENATHSQPDSQYPPGPTGATILPEIAAHTCPKHITCIIAPLDAAYPGPGAQRPSGQGRGPRELLAAHVV